MSKRLRLADWLIELLMSAVVISLYFSGKISLAVALLGIVICLSITLPHKRRKITKVKR
ncbi:MAG TPA: hypothetical protein VL728_17305 [Cyclobacteriaceae bacterium]|nr:hypothetical protein [Cyclobacteriaceae bacterium]